MLATISAAAAKAHPGDVITVHQGIYRERIDPPRGGLSDSQRIVYQAAPGEKAEIVGSETVTGRVKAHGDVWKVVVPNRLFGAFNPYSDLIHGDWFEPNNRQHHTGAVYLNGEWLVEAAQLDDLFKPAEGEALWFGRLMTSRLPSGPNLRGSILILSSPKSTYARASSIRQRRASTSSPFEG